MHFTVRKSYYIVLMHACQKKSSTHKSPHVLMTFNPSESIDIKVSVNISMRKLLTRLFLTTTAGSFGSKISKVKKKKRRKKKKGTGSIPSHQEVWAAAF